MALDKGLYDMNSIQTLQGSCVSDFESWMLALLSRQNSQYGPCQCNASVHDGCCLQDRLQHVLDDVDPVDLSHVMWAVARLDSYPAPGLLDALLATLPPQIDSAEPAVRRCAMHPWPPSML